MPPGDSLRFIQPTRCRRPAAKPCASLPWPGRAWCCLADFMTREDRRRGDLVQVLARETGGWYAQPVHAYRNTSWPRASHRFLDYVAQRMRGSRAIEGARPSHGPRAATDIRAAVGSIRHRARLSCDRRAATDPADRADIQSPTMDMDIVVRKDDRTGQDRDPPCRHQGRHGRIPASGPGWSREAYAQPEKAQ